MKAFLDLQGHGADIILFKVRPLEDSVIAKHSVAEDLTFHSGTSGGVSPSQR